ncbi:MAG: 50S ribosomal protein L30 [Spirochaetaceae bacterium]|jgi:large subunit ribosomal protein L30|nr:50S ribosomal protein L30 [Spirochaetaceae bacterium]
MADGVKKIKIQLVRSTIGTLPVQRATVRSLGLRKIGSSVEHEVNSAILGMVRKVSHLVSVEEC